VWRRPLPPNLHEKEHPTLHPYPFPPFRSMHGGTGKSLLLHDSKAEYVREALRVVGSARLRRGQGGKYGATLDDLRLKIVLAEAAGLATEVIADQSKSYKVKLDSFLLDAKTIKGGIDIWIDGSDFQRAGELLKVLTIGFQEIH
jgi:hypothetical protein